MSVSLPANPKRPAPITNEVDFTVGAFVSVVQISTSGQRLGVAIGLEATVKRRGTFEPKSVATSAYRCF